MPREMYIDVGADWDSLVVYMEGGEEMRRGG
jgi:hypothetical protein